MERERQRERQRERDDDDDEEDDDGKILTGDIGLYSQNYNLKILINN